MSRAICPKCGREGSGIYRKTVKNHQKKPYRYLYFAHKKRGKVSWCYIGKDVKGLEVSEKCLRVERS